MRLLKERCSGASSGVVDAAVFVAPGGMARRFCGSGSWPSGAQAEGVGVRKGSDVERAIGRAQRKAVDLSGGFALRPLSGPVRTMPCHHYLYGTVVHVMHGHWADLLGELGGCPTRSVAVPRTVGT